MTHIVIMRGLPGSGKSTLARTIAANQPAGAAVIVSADDFFVGDDGVYRFNPAQIADAHAQCLARFEAAISDPKVQLVIVDNTNTQRWEFAKYVAPRAGIEASVTIIPVFDGGLTDEELAARNTHGVPVEAIRRMRARWEV